jgi:serine acetyltransferase
MFWEKFVLRVYHSLRTYIRQRQRDGAIKNVEPFVVVRAFVGMIIHHSLNNNLWDRERQLLRISNQAAARSFTDILLNGVSLSKAKPRRNGKTSRPLNSKGKKSKK